MVEKIGNNSTFRLAQFLSILFFGTIQAEVDITLRLMDANGNKLDQAQVNVPFAVEVTVSGDGQQLPIPEIVGLNQFVMRGSSSGSSTFIQNGVSTNRKELHINLLAKKEGRYSIGPAQVEVDGVTKESTILTFIVGKEQKTIEEQDEQVFVEIEFDKEVVYAGQPVLFTLRFYHANNAIRLGRVEEPEFENFTTSKLEGPRSGTRTVEGDIYHYLEWTATVYPKKIGILTVPAVKAEYSVPIKTRDGFGIFGGIAQIFGNIRNQHVSHSNSTELDVIPLPEHTPPAKAIGNFTNIELHVNNATAGKGEGIAATLDLYGTGNIAQLEHPQLELPEDLTFYESNTQITAVGNEYKKSFEYVIQGRAPGDYTIDAQEFFYFDLATETYKTLTTQPLSLTITGSAKTADNATEEEVPKISQEVPLTFLETGAWKQVRLRVFNWLWFFVLMLIPFIAWVGLFLTKRRKDYLMRNAPQLRYNNAFKQARKTFKKARAGNYEGQLYHMFIELFAARSKVSRSQMSEDSIEQILRAAHISEADIVQWRLLFAHLAEHAFSSYRVQGKQDTLFNKAAGWLRRLETIL